MLKKFANLDTQNNFGLAMGAGMALVGSFLLCRQPLFAV